jgi:hypothetical protein
MDILYKAKFLGQGYVIPEGTIIDIVAERKTEQTILTAKDGELLYILNEWMVEKI